MTWPSSWTDSDCCCSREHLVDARREQDEPGGRGRGQAGATRVGEDEDLGRHAVERVGDRGERGAHFAGVEDVELPVAVVRDGGVRRGGDELEAHPAGQHQPEHALGVRAAPVAQRLLGVVDDEADGRREAADLHLVGGGRNDGRYGEQASQREGAGEVADAEDGLHAEALTPQTCQPRRPQRPADVRRISPSICCRETGYGIAPERSMELGQPARSRRRRKPGNPTHGTDGRGSDSAPQACPGSRSPAQAPRRRGRRPRVAALAANPPARG